MTCPYLPYQNYLDILKLFSLSVEVVREDSSEAFNAYQITFIHVNFIDEDTASPVAFSLHDTVEFLTLPRN
jgi:hypothetical protein